MNSGRTDWMDAWRYASTYPRIPYLAKEAPDPVDFFRTRVGPDRWLTDRLYVAITADMERKREQFMEFMDSSLTQAQSEKSRITLRELHSGYVVELRNGSRWIVARAGNFERILVDNKGSWGFLDRSYNNDLTMKPGVTGVIGGTKTRDIIKVYGLIQSNRHWQDAAQTDIGLSYRPLLWQRKDVKELTVDQISALLGYEVKVIGESK